MIFEVSILLYILLSCEREREAWICKEARTAHCHGAGWGCSIDYAEFSGCNEVKLTRLESCSGGHTAEITSIHVLNFPPIRCECDLLF